MLQIVDRRWREHLENMDYLRDGIHLRAMAQKDPLTEYRAEGHALFQELNAAIREEVVLNLFHAQIEPAEASELDRAREAQAVNGNLQFEHESVAGADAIAAAGRRRRLRRPVASRSVATPIGSGGAGGRDAAANRNGAGEDRPERSLLVRLGQEVQEVPRSIAGETMFPPLAPFFCARRG